MGVFYGAGAMSDTKVISLKEEIHEKIIEYYELCHKDKSNIGKIHYAGRVYDDKEMLALTDAALEFWLTAGRYAKQFEQKFADFLGVKHCSLVNSGSSANLLAFMALTSPLLKDRQVRRGDEVITVAAGFPTTVSPMTQYGAVPVFVDITIPEYNIDVSQLEDAYSSKTKAVMIAHTLGNPFNLKAIKDFCDKHNLWLIEDNCDALGSKYFLDGREVFTGTVGDIATSSFYPPHHITMGEGGAVYTNDDLLHKIIRSFRDWGRECNCPSGVDNSCGQRFSGQFGELPRGYDHKYVYSHFGYNLKATDMQAAVGCVQLDKLNSFIEKRKANWKFLHDKLEQISDALILPQAEKNSDPSWFGFLLSVREGGDLTRNGLVQHLEKSGIQTRMLFAGNIVRHPCFDEMRREKAGYRVVVNLKNTDYLMNNGFWIGVYPGLKEIDLERMADTIIEYVEKQPS